MLGTEKYLYEECVPECDTHRLPEHSRESGVYGAWAAKAIY